MNPYDYEALRRQLFVKFATHRGERPLDFTPLQDAWNEATIHAQYYYDRHCGEARRNEAFEALFNAEPDSPPRPKFIQRLRRWWRSL